MTNLFTSPRPVLVRAGFTEQDTWRDVLGNQEPLRCFALLGDNLDAPDVFPAGAMRAARGPSQDATPVVAFR